MLDNHRAVSERLLLGRHPSAPCRRGGRHSGIRTDRADQASEGRGAGRGGARLFLRARLARGAGARLSRPYRRCARHRPAAGDPHPRRRRGLRPHPRRGGGQGPVQGGAALLHRRARARDEGDRAGAFDLLHGHFDLQEVASPARTRRRAAGRPHHGRDRCAVSGARQIPRQAQRAVLRGRGGKGAGRNARAYRCEEISRQTTENFFRLFSKVPAPKAAA